MPQPAAPPLTKSQQKEVRRLYLKEKRDGIAVAKILRVPRGHVYAYLHREKILRVGGRKPGRATFHAVNAALKRSVRASSAPSTSREATPDIVGQLTQEFALALRRQGVTGISAKTINGLTTFEFKYETTISVTL